MFSCFLIFALLVESTALESMSTLAIFLWTLFWKILFSDRRLLHLFPVHPSHSTSLLAQLGSNIFIEHPAAFHDTHPYLVGDSQDHVPGETSQLDHQSELTCLLAGVGLWIALAVRVVLSTSWHVRVNLRLSFFFMTARGLLRVFFFFLGVPTFPDDFCVFIWQHEVPSKSSTLDLIMDTADIPFRKPCCHQNASHSRIWKGWQLYDNYKFANLVLFTFCKKFIKRNYGFGEEKFKRLIRSNVEDCYKSFLLMFFSSAGRCQEGCALQTPVKFLLL